MSYFFEIRQIQEQISSYSASMSQLLLYFLEFPEGDYNKFWQDAYEKGYFYNLSTIKNYIHILRSLKMLEIDEQTHQYKFIKNVIINPLDNICGTGFQKAEKIVSELYNLNTDDDFQGIYRIYDKQNNLQYIGSSIHCKKRIIEHYRDALWKGSQHYNTNKYIVLRNMINTNNIQIKFEPFNGTEHELRIYETQKIKEEKPILNVKDNK